MSLRLVLSPTPGRITPAKLRAELLAAGVPLQPEKPLEPLNCYYSGNHFAVLLPVDTDQWDTTVQQVVPLPVSVRPSQSKNWASFGSMRMPICTLLTPLQPVMYMVCHSPPR